MIKNYAKISEHQSNQHSIIHIMVLVWNISFGVGQKRKIFNKDIVKSPALPMLSSIKSTAHSKHGNPAADVSFFRPATVVTPLKQAGYVEAAEKIQTLPKNNGVIQRSVIEGHDHAGHYSINDETCRMDYQQDWYFNFPTDKTEEQKNSYMQAAQSQVHDVWSGRFPIKPIAGINCPCTDNGFEVEANLNTREGERRGRGYAVRVTDTEERGLTIPPTESIELGTSHEHALNMGDSLTQRRIAHEFGHAIGLTDEYTGWARTMGTRGSRDRESIMHSGDAVRERHYQVFADLLNLDLAGTGCRYAPNGIRQSSYENLVDMFHSIPFGTELRPGDRSSGFHYDRRLSNAPWLGLMYPTLGMDLLPEAGGTRIGPTVGLRLNQLAYPFRAGIRGGLAIDPTNPSAGLSIPLSADIGLGWESTRFGLGYTADINPADPRSSAHAVGLGVTGEF